MEKTRWVTNAAAGTFLALASTGVSWPAQVVRSGTASARPVVAVPTGALILSLAAPAGTAGPRAAGLGTITAAPLPIIGMGPAELVPAMAAAPLPGPEALAPDASKLALPVPALRSGIVSGMAPASPAPAASADDHAAEAAHAGGGAMFDQSQPQAKLAGAGGAPAAVAGVVSYGSRPDILSLPARRHRLPGERWERVKLAHLEGLAEILELYPEHDVFFLARDAEYLYDLGKVLLRGTPDEERVHLINVSRANVDDPHLLDYLRQKGLKPEEMAKGKKVLFVDTGFFGTIPAEIDNRLPRAAQGMSRTKLIASDNPRHGSTRAFLQMLETASSVLEPDAMHGPIGAYEGMARYTPRSNAFHLIGGRWEAVSTKSANLDGRVDQAKTLVYMEDLRSLGERGKARAYFDRLRSHWRGFRGARSREELVAALKRHLETQTAFGEGRVRDYVEYLERDRRPLRVDLAELGLARLPAKKSVWHVEPADKLAQWSPILRDPSTEIPKLVKQGSYQTLANVLEAAKDVAVDRAAVKALAGVVTNQSRALIRALMKKGTVDHHIASYVLADPRWKEHPELVSALLAKGTADEWILEAALSQSHWKDHPEWVELIIRRGKLDALVAESLPPPTGWLRGIFDGLVARLDWAATTGWDIVEGFLRDTFGSGEAAVSPVPSAPRRWRRRWVMFWRASLELQGADRDRFIERHRPYAMP